MITYCTVCSVQGYQHSSYDEDNVTKEEHVNIKKKSAKNRALRDTLSKQDRERYDLLNRDYVLSVIEI